MNQVKRLALTAAIITAVAGGTIAFAVTADAAARPSVGRDAGGNFHFCNVGSTVKVNGTLDDTKGPKGAYCFTVAGAAAGKDGAAGAAGVTGPAGPAGPKGDTGATGPKGDPGAVPAATFAAIAPAEKTLTHIGVSVKSDCGCAGGGTTDLGSVTLPAGTWDVRIMGGFSGIKASVDLASGEEIIGGLFLASDDHISSGFAQVITQNQGVKIPHTATGTLTVDPTDNLSDFITLTAPTTVHVLAYAYSTASQDRSDLGVKANIRTAKFLKVS